MNLSTDEVGDSKLPERSNSKIARRREPGGGVRLSPLPAGNTLLTIFFFSLVALAIGYWVLFPPATANSPHLSTTPTTSTTPRPAAAEPLHPH